jgi:hypothetical protein
MGVAINAATGRFDWLPSSQMGADDGVPDKDPYEYKLNSRLLVVNGHDGEDDQTPYAPRCYVLEDEAYPRLVKVDCGVPAFTTAAKSADRQSPAIAPPEGLVQCPASRADERVQTVNGIYFCKPSVGKNFPAEITPAAAAARPSAPPETSHPAAAASTSSSVGQQDAFVGIVEEARRRYQAAANDMAKGGVRAWRKDAICKALPSLTVDDWKGEIYLLSSNSDGKGVVAITIGPDIYVKTWNNSLSDINGHTLIEPNSSVFRTLSAMKKGDHVRFSGRFVPGNADCALEGSLTQDGSMTEPEFILRFSAVSAD